MKLKTCDNDSFIATVRNVCERSALADDYGWRSVYESVCLGKYEFSSAFPGWLLPSCTARASYYHRSAVSGIINPVLCLLVT